MCLCGCGCGCECTSEGNSNIVCGSYDNALSFSAVLTQCLLLICCMGSHVVSRISFPYCNLCCSCHGDVWCSRLHIQ